MNYLLILAAIFNLLAAFLHLGCIIFGQSWYQFFGAGEKTLHLLARKKWAVNLLTAFIVFVLFVWSIYAFSGAGLIPPLPFMKTGLFFIGFIYLFRGLIGFFSSSFRNQFVGNSNRFWQVSSAICLLVGMLHLIGVILLY